MTLLVVGVRASPGSCLRCVAVFQTSHESELHPWTNVELNLWPRLELAGIEGLLIPRMRKRYELHCAIRAQERSYCCCTACHQSYCRSSITRVLTMCRTFNPAAYGCKTIG